MTDTVDAYVLGKAVLLRQPAAGFRTGLDAVMMAAACPAQAGDRVLELGSGVGGAALCLLHRVPDCHVTGIEIQPAYHALAITNASLNNRTGRCDFICADVFDFSVASPSERFDHIICNPPYLEAGRYMQAADEGRATALAHKTQDVALKDWIDVAFQNLQPGGCLTMIHRADAVDRLVKGLGKRFGAVEIIPLWPRAGVEAKRVIVRARKDRQTPARILPGLVLHEADGAYTDAAEAILRRGESLFL